MPEVDVVAERLALERVLDREVRPFIQGHGGDVEIVEVVDATVKVRFRAACQNCELKSVTYAGRIRPALLALPQVDRVECAEVSLSEARLDSIQAFFA
jgi:Fe-S cluster biogenesis protein NfuA